MSMKYLMTAAALYSPHDRVSIRTGFYEGEEGEVLYAGMMVHVKLDNIPQPIIYGWNQVNNITNPATPFKYNRNR